MPLSFLRPRANSPVNIVWRERWITPEGCQQIADYCERSLTAEDGVMAGASTGASARQSTIAWLPRGKDTEAIYKLVRDEVQALNEAHFGFDLIGYRDLMQYTRYGARNDHYDWHIDCAPGEQSFRKLSIIVQLADETAYDGGDVEFQVPGGVSKLPRSRGTLGVFSSFMLHRVTAVTRGERKSLVAWISGPPFR